MHWQAEGGKRNDQDQDEAVSVLRGGSDIVRASKIAVLPNRLLKVVRWQSAFDSGLCQNQTRRHRGVE